jgi:hypothetical protein
LPIENKGWIGAVPQRERANRAFNRQRASLFHAAQMRIGQELKVYYEIPEELPHEMVVLLKQFKEHQRNGQQITDGNNPI